MGENGPLISSSEPMMSLCGLYRTTSTIDSDFNCQSLCLRHRQEIERRTEEAANYLLKIKEQFEQKGIETITRIAYGNVAGSIIFSADEEGADLIALASHGKGGLSRVFYGSVSAGVLQRVDRPLLIVRSRRYIL
jgi:nucleotide-binding universal stress UspA family protein